MAIDAQENGPQESVHPEPRITNYAEFYLYYLREHAHPTCRNLHYVGTVLSLIILVAAIFVHPLWILAGPVAGYGFAWSAHFFIEKNKPATFKYPLWSLISDYKMFFSWLTGRLASQLRQAGVAS